MDIENATEASSNFDTMSIAPSQLKSVAVRIIPFSVDEDWSEMLGVSSEFEFAIDN
jgi:hypothetical protein